MFSVPSDPTISKVIITKGSVDGVSEPIIEHSEKSELSAENTGDKKRIG